MDSWKTVSYVQKGIHHEKDHIDCQDNVCLFENDAFLIAALSDGLGSLKYSSIASKAAVETICTLFQDTDALLKANQNEDMLKQSILNAIREVIQQRADEAGVSTSEMDCTLVFVCIDKQKQRAFVGRLGDSAICLMDSAQSIALSESGALANATSTVMDRKASKYFSINSYNLNRQEILGFILTSDGLENEIYTKGSGHVSKSAELYFNAFFASPDPQALVAESVQKLTSIPDTPFDDDISLLVLSRAKEPVALPDDPTWLCSCGARNPLLVTYCLNCNMDFSVLYQNIKFREHGGKASFFTRINRDPTHEQAIVEAAAERIAIRQKQKKQTTRFGFTEIRQPPVASVEPPVAPEQKSAAAADHQTAAQQPLTQNAVQDPEKHNSNPENAHPSSSSQPSSTEEQSAFSVPSGAFSVQGAQEAVPQTAPAMQPEPSAPKNGSAIPVHDPNRPASKGKKQKQHPSRPQQYSAQQQYAQQQYTVQKQYQQSQAAQQQRTASGRGYAGNSSSHRTPRRSFRTVALVALATFFLGFLLGCITTKAIMSKRNTQTMQRYEESLPVTDSETETLTDQSQGDSWDDESHENSWDDGSGEDVPQIQTWDADPSGSDRKLILFPDMTDSN